MDMHVHYRVAKKTTKPQEKNVEFHRKWSLFGKKQPKLTNAPQNPKVYPLPKTSPKPSPKITHKSHTSLHQIGKESKQKTETIDKEEAECNRKQPHCFCETKPMVVADSFASPDLPASKKAVVGTPHQQHKSIEKTEVCNLSDISDNTEVLCSHDIVEKTFSYAEKNGVNSIHNWLQLCSPNVQANDVKHPKCGSPLLPKNSPVLKRQETQFVFFL